MFSEIEATEDGSRCCAVLEEFDGVDEYDQIDAVCFILTEDDYDTPEPYDNAMRELFERNGVSGTIPVHTPWNGWEDVRVSDLTKPKNVRTKAQFRAMRDRIDLTGKPPEQVVLTYFRDQQMYDDHGRDVGRFGQANATARAVAFALEDLGCNVVFAYPDEGAISTEGSRY